MGYEVKWVPIADIKPHPDNPRHHDLLHVEAVAESIAEDGWLENVVLSSDNHCLGGHARLAGALARGETHAPAVIYTHPHDDPRSLKVMVKLNSLGTPVAGNPRTPKDDADDLSQLLCSIAAEVGLQGTGYDEESLTELITQAEAHAPTGVAPANTAVLGTGRDTAMIVCPDCGSEFPAQKWLAPSAK